MLKWKTFIFPEIASANGFVNFITLLWVLCCVAQSEERSPVLSGSPGIPALSGNQSSSFLIVSRWIKHLRRKATDAKSLDEECGKFMYERNNNELKKLIRLIKSQLDGGEHVDTKENCFQEMCKGWWKECSLRKCTYLYLAIYAGHLELFNYLIEKGANVNEPCLLFDSALLAVDLDRTEFGNPLTIVKTLLDNGAEIDIKDKMSGDTILHKIVRHGIKHRQSSAFNETIFIAKILLELGGNLKNMKNRAGDTPLLTALRTFSKDEQDILEPASENVGDLEDETMVDVLMDHGADSSSKNNDGWTPLFYALLNCDMRSAIRLLMEKEVDVRTALPDGRTVLHLNTCPRERSIAYILLISNGAEVNAKQYDGNTPLHIAVHKNWYSKHDFKYVTLLLERGADPNAINAAGDTPLLVATREAVYNTNDTIVRMLIDHGADISIKNENNWTALAYAVNSYNIGMVELLLDGGADVNVQLNDGRTPLHIIASNYYRFNPVIAKLLLGHGADPNVVDGNGDAPLLLATSMANSCSGLPTVKTLLENGADIDAKGADNWTALHIAVDQGCDLIAKLLLEAGADVSARLPDGRTVLHLVGEQDCPSEVMARQLLDAAGVDINAKMDDGSTPLYSAVAALTSLSGNCVNYLQLLLEHGADPNAMDIAGDTPLLMAARSTMWWDGYFNNNTMARRLLEPWATAKIIYNYTWTPLHYAVDNCNFDAAKMLLERGADVNAKLSDGRTAMDLIPCGKNASGLLRRGRSEIDDSAKLITKSKERNCTEFHPGLLDCSDGMITLKMKNVGSKESIGPDQKSVINRNFVKLMSSPIKGE